MPKHFIETLDDHLVHDGQLSFSGGVNSYIRENMLFEDQSELLENADVDRDGEAFTRRGTETLGTIVSNEKIQGMYFYKNGTTKQMMAIVDDKAYVYDGTSWTLQIGYTPTAGNDVEMVQLVNKLYLTDGTKNVYSWDGTLFTDMGNGATDPPHAKYLIRHRGRLVAAGIEGNLSEIAFSDVLEAAIWPATGKLEIVSSNNDEVTGIYSWVKNLIFVGCENSCHLIDADPLKEDDTTGVATFPVEQIDDTVSFKSHRSLQKVGKDLFGLFSDGVRSITRILQGDQADIGEPISRPVQDIIERINGDYAHMACSARHRHFYLLGVPLDTSTVNDHVLVWNNILGLLNIEKGWTGHWKGWSPTVFVKSTFGSEVRLDIAESNGRVLRWLDYVPEDDEAHVHFEDAGTDIATTLISRTMNFRDPRSPKTGYVLEAEFSRSRCEVTISVILDQGSAVALDNMPVDTYAGKLTLPLTLPFNLPDYEKIHRVQRDLMSRGSFRDIKVKISSTKRKLGLREIILSGYLDSLET